MGTRCQAAAAAVAVLMTAWPAALQAQAPFLVKDINTQLDGPDSSDPRSLVVVGDVLYHGACLGPTHCGLWRYFVLDVDGYFR